MKQHIPVIGSYFVKEIPASDNVGAIFHLDIEKQNPEKAESEHYGGDESGWICTLLRP